MLKNVKFAVCLITKNFQKKEGTKNTWTLIEQTEKVINHNEYNKIIEAIPFFRKLGGTETQKKGNTSIGNICIKLTSKNPGNSVKVVREFKGFYKYTDAMLFPETVKPILVNEMKEVEVAPTRGASYKTEYNITMGKWQVSNKVSGCAMVIKGRMLWNTLAELRDVLIHEDIYLCLRTYDCINLSLNVK
jgi:hypothetical protein